MNLIIKGIMDHRNVKRLYKRAFPFKERFPYFVLRVLTRLKFIEVLAFYEEAQLCGFAYIIVQEKVVFIMYLAVAENFLNRGYGSQILSLIKQRYQSKTIILDIEKLDDKAANATQRIRMLNFYLRNGFYETNHYFTMRGVEYEILATDRSFKMADYNKFWENVYRRKK